MKTRSSAAFTLIETMAALVIILVLTGLVMSISGFVTGKSSRSRTTSELLMLATAAESYKADTGVFPRDIEATESASNTDRLSPKLHFISTGRIREIKSVPL